MRLRTKIFAFFTGLTLLAGTSGFEPINFCGICSTQPFGINSRGEISGTFVDSGGDSHGFFKQGAVFISFDGAPGTVFTEAGHINNKGQIAGDSVSGDDFIDRPFIRNADGTIDQRPGFPGASVTFAAGITDSGLLVGSYTLDPTGSTGFTGYVLHGSNFTHTFHFPGENVTDTFALDVNNAGTIVGSYKTTTPDEEHGFVRHANGAFEQIDYPDSVQTEFFGINDSGAMVGRYLDHSGVQHGFQLRKGKFGRIDYANANNDPHTYTWGINNVGEIVGYTFPGDPAAGPWSGFGMGKLSKLP